MKNEVPNPGTKKAIEKGCTCPIMDNSYGKGYYGQGGIFITNVGCKVHDVKKGK